jgi:peptidoglycan hydrolase-like protein with peptidoglycan-binding domain
MTRGLVTRRISGWAVPVALWLAPVAVFVLLLPSALVADVGSPTITSAGSVTAGERVRDLRTATTVTIAEAVTVPFRLRVGGTVTSLPRTLQVASGVTVIGVDGLPIRALVSDDPVYRDLRRDDRGPDVAAAAGFLAALGYDPGAGPSVFGPKMEHAVKAFQRADGLEPDGVFHVDRVAYVTPEAAGEITFDITLGQDITAGDDLGTSAAAGGSVRLASLDGDADLDAIFGDEPVTLSYRQEAVELASVGAVGTDPTASDAVRDLVDSLRASGVLGTGPDLTTDAVEGFSLALTTPQRLGSVPGRAIVAGADGELCVHEATEEGVHPVPVTVQASSSELGVAYVDADLIGRVVTIAPAVGDVGGRPCS